MSVLNTRTPRCSTSGRVLDVDPATTNTAGIERPTITVDAPSARLQVEDADLHGRGRRDSGERLARGGGRARSCSDCGRVLYGRTLAFFVAEFRQR